MEQLKASASVLKNCKVAVHRAYCGKAAVYTGEVRYSTEAIPLEGTTSDMRCDDM